MAKIDCSVTVDFLREWRRMCESYDDDECFEACPMNGIANDKHRSCTDMAQKNPERAIKIVQKWSDEHPVMTRLDDLLKKYPKAQLDKITGCPTIRPAKLGYCDGCFSCSNTAQTHHSCWHEPLVGGATGKAVE